MLKNTKNIAQKLKTMELVHIYFIKKNRSTIIANFLAFLLFIPQNLPPPLDPGPGGTINADPCGSKSTTLLITTEGRTADHL